MCKDMLDAEKFRLYSQCDLKSCPNPLQLVAPHLKKNNPGIKFWDDLYEGDPLVSGIIMQGNMSHPALTCLIMLNLLPSLGGRRSPPHEGLFLPGGRTCQKLPEVGGTIIMPHAGVRRNTRKWMIKLQRGNA